MFFEEREECIVLNIKAHPNGGRNSFEGVVENELKIRIKAIPSDNEANNELVSFLSKSFKIAKSDIEFLSGENSRKKRLKLPKSQKLIEFIKDNIE